MNRQRDNIMRPPTLLGGESIINSWETKLAGRTQVNERAQNMQSAAAGRPKSAGVTAETDWWSPGMPGTLAYTNQHTMYTSVMNR